MNENSIRKSSNKNSLSHLIQAAIEDDFSSQISEYDSDSNTLSTSFSVVVATNEEKYASVNLPYGTSADLSEVFELMRSLNLQGITDPNVGCYGGGKTNFASVLNNACNILAHRYQGQRVRYVELGPEPIKTELMISGLLARGVDLASSVSVDINPESATPMREAVKRVKSDISVDHVLGNFDEITRDNIPGSGATVFTSLGFQEGNHMPENVRTMLGKLLDKNDCYMSEMQVWSKESQNAVLNFYKLEQMRAFSKNCLRRAYGNVESTYNIQLVEIPSIAPGMKAATTTETFYDDDGETVHYVTNYCLKPTVEQLIALREKNGDVSVFETLLTSDQSMMLQLSEKTA